MKIIFEILIPALMQVESCGVLDAIGDDGEAVGCLQIHKIVVDDVNRILARAGKEYTFTYEDRYDYAKSVMMCEIFLDYYFEKYVMWWNNQYAKSFHHPMPFNVCECMARLWNGGYEGLKRNPQATDNYWATVKEELGYYANN